MKRLTIIACVLLTLTVTSLKAYDTLLYQTAFEASRLKKALAGDDVDLLSVFLAIDSDSVTYMRYREKLNNFYRLLDPKVLNITSHKQKAKLIFKEVHAHFFTRYEEHVLFSQVFKDGVYNCVSASMLYTLILENYGIPFDIKEKPTHVYLVTYPNDENILFETTNPRGFYVPDEKAKQEYLDGLITMKFTTREHVNSVGQANAFNEFFYNNQNISLNQLAGLQYHNRAVTSYEEKNINRAIQCVAKLNLLYPRPKHEAMKITFLSVALSNSNFDSVNDILYLCQYANVIRDINDRKQVIVQFDQILEKKLFKESNDTLVAKAFELVTKNIVDKELVGDISYSYYLYMSQWYSMKGEMNKSLTFASQAYRYNQKDARLQELIVRAIMLKTDKVKDKEKNIATLDAYILEFPFITTNRNFRMFRLYQLSMSAYNLFNHDKGAEAYKRMEELEVGLESEKELATADEVYLGMPYAEAGAYHYRRKEYTKARAILKKGLEIAPGHFELLERLRIVEEEFK